MSECSDGNPDNPALYTKPQTPPLLPTAAIPSPETAADIEILIAQWQVREIQDVLTSMVSELQFVTESQKCMTRLLGLHYSEWRSFCSKHREAGVGVEPCTTAPLDELIDNRSSQVDVGMSYRGSSHAEQKASKNSATARPKSAKSHGSTGVSISIDDIESRADSPRRTILSPKSQHGRGLEEEGDGRGEEGKTDADATKCIPNTLCTADHGHPSPERSQSKLSYTADHVPPSPARSQSKLRLSSVFSLLSGSRETSKFSRWSRGPSTNRLTGHPEHDKLPRGVSRIDSTRSSAYERLIRRRGTGFSSVASQRNTIESESPMLEQRQQLRKQHSSFAARIVAHPAFDIFWGLMIVIDSVLVGIEVQWRASLHSTPRLFVHLSYVFCVAYFLELTMRVSALKRAFFKTNVWGNWLDVILVGASLIEVAIQAVPETLGPEALSSDVLQNLLIFRLCRTARLFRFNNRLRLMAVMIIDSISSLVVTLVLILLVVFVFSLTFTIGATQYLQSRVGERDAIVNDVDKYYGSVPRSAYTCLRAFMGGQSWGEMLNPLSDVGAQYVCVYLFYILFTILALLNVVTSIFVDGALFRSSTQRDLIVEKELQTKRVQIQNLRDIFVEADTDCNGTMSYNEFLAILDKEDTQAYLHSLGVTHENSRDIFNELDRETNGAIEMEEFLENMFILMTDKFTALDQQRLFFEVRSITKKQEKLLNAIVPFYSPSTRSV